MNGSTGPVEITGFATLLVLILSSLVIPAWLRHRRNETVEGRQTVASWQGITATLQKERDALRIRLDKIDSDHEARLRDLTESFHEQIRALEKTNREQQKQMDALRAEVERLYAERGRRG